MTDAALVARYRRFLLVVALCLFAGTLAELVLTEHWEAWRQGLAFGLAAAGLLAVAAVLVRAGGATRRLLRAAMGVVAAGSLAGVFFHAQGNWLFERDIRPAAPVGAVTWEALFGASPLLAPGILLVGAVLAWAATWEPAAPPCAR